MDFYKDIFYMLILSIYSFMLSHIFDEEKHRHAKAWVLEQSPIYVFLYILCGSCGKERNKWYVPSFPVFQNCRKTKTGANELRDLLPRG